MVSVGDGARGDVGRARAAPIADARAIASPESVTRTHSSSFPSSSLASASARAEGHERADRLADRDSLCRRLKSSMASTSPDGSSRARTAREQTLDAKSFFDFGEETDSESVRATES